MKLPPGETNTSPYTLNPLETYLGRGNYERLAGTHSSYETICDLIAKTDPATIIAVDGPSNGGKTTFTETFIDFYRTQNIPITFIPLDYFLTDRRTRSDLTAAIAEGRIGIDNYSQLAWEQERFRETIQCVKTIAQSSQEVQEIAIPNVYNRQTGDKADTKTISVEPGAIIITEGVGIQIYHHDLFDLTVRVDTYDDKIILERLRMRELQKHDAALRLDDSFLKERLQQVDIPHTHYLRDNAPSAHFVIDTSCFEEMAVYRHR